MKLDITKAWISQSLEHERVLTRCAFSPDGKYLVAGGQDEKVQCWELESGKKSTFAAHRSWVDAIAFHPDKQRVFTADFHGAIHCWPFAAANPKPQWSQAAAHKGWIRTLLVAPDGNLLSAGNDHVVKLWSAANGKLLRVFTGHENYVFSMAFHPDGKTFVSGDLFGKVRQWDYKSGKLLRTFDATALNTRLENFLADVGGVRSMAMDHAGKLLACGGMTDAKSNGFCPGKPAILVFDWASGKLLHTLRPQHTSDGPIKGLAFLPDGTIAGHAEHLNSGSSLEFWKSNQPKSIHVIKRSSGYCLDLHPDGLRLAAASFKGNGRGGNGRHTKPEEYTSHNGEIAIFSLFEKPAEEKQ